MIEVTEVRGGEYVCICPLHNDDNASLYINPRKNLAHCFAGCYSGNAVGFIAKAEGLNKVSAWRQLLSGGIFIFSDKQNKKIKTLSETNPNIKLTWLPGDRTKYLIKRGFLRSTIRFWDIMYSPEIRHIRIPVYSNDGVLLSYSYRTVDDIEPKYLHPGFSKRSGLLFGEHFFEEHNGIVNLVEGPLDCIWMWQNGFHNTVAFMGNPSVKQIERLSNLGHSVRFCLDNDDAGDKMMHYTVSKFNGGIKSYYAISLPEGIKDVQELNKEALMKILFGYDIIKQLK